MEEQPRSELNKEIILLAKKLLRKERKEQYRKFYEQLINDIEEEEAHKNDKV